MEKIETEGLVVANPYNDKHIEATKEFEKKLPTNLPIKTSQMLNKIKEQITEQEYKNRYLTEEVITENIFYGENGEWKSSCYMEWDKNRGTTELTIITPPCYQKLGYASKLLTQLEQELFQNSGIERLEMTIAKDNIASIRLAAKQGFYLSEANEVYQTWIKENPYVKEGSRIK